MQGGMSKKELAAYFRVSLKTLSRWTEPIKEEIGEYQGRKYTPKQVKIILSHLE